MVTKPRVALTFKPTNNSTINLKLKNLDTFNQQTIKSINQSIKQCHQLKN